MANGQFGKTTAQAHICKVTTTWFGFRRICRRSNQVIDTVELSLPDYTYESQVHDLEAYLFVDTYHLILVCVHCQFLIVTTSIFQIFVILTLFDTRLFGFEFHNQ